MRTLPIIFLIALLSFLLDSCRHDADSRLTAAEALMDERPDSALVILDSIDPAGLRGDENHALYAMLLTMAQAKNHLQPTDDSLISIAVDYYRTHDDPLRAAISSYYQGRVYYLRDSMPAALVSYMRAKDIAERNDLFFWAGMSCRGIADIYKKIGNYGAQLTYARKQKDYTIRSEKQPYVDYALIDYACALHNAFHTDSSLKVLDAVLDSAIQKRDENLYYQVQRFRAQGLLSENKFKEAFEPLQELWQGGYALPMDSVNFIWCLSGLGEYKKALETVDTVSGDGRPMKTLLLVKYYKNTGDYKKTVEVMEALDSMSNEVLETSLANPLSDHMETFYDLSRQLDEARIQTTRSNYQSILLGILILGGVASYIAFAIYKRQKRELELKLALADNLRDQLSTSETLHRYTVNKLNDCIANKESEILHHLNELEGLKQSIDETETDRNRVSGLITTLRIAETGMLEELGQIINAEGNSIEMTNKKIAAVISKFVQSYSHNGKVSILEEYANNIHDGLLHSLRSDLTGMKEPDYRLFLYSVLGYTVPTITLMLGETKIEKIYERKRRLKKRINTLPEDIKEKYLKYL